MDKIYTPAEQLKALTTSFWKSQVLMTAVKVNLFKEMGDQTLASHEISSRLGLDPDALERLLLSLAALGLLHQRSSGYAVKEAYRPYLCFSGSKDMSGAILHMDRLQAKWQRLDEALRSGEPIDFDLEIPESEIKKGTEHFMDAMESFASNTAEELVHALPMKGDEEFIDLGCGPGTYFRRYLQAYPNMKATAVDTEQVIPVTRRFVERDGLGDRVTYIDGDLREVVYRKDFYDVALLSNVVHIYSPEEVSKICELAYGAIRPGGLILINEFFTDKTGTRPHWGALFSLNMLINTKGGRNYRLEQGEHFLIHAGFTGLKTLTLCMYSTLLLGKKPAG